MLHNLANTTLTSKVWHLQEFLLGVFHSPNLFIDSILTWKLLLQSTTDLLHQT